MKEKITCGQVFPSGCITYTGDLPLFIPEDSITCAPSLDDIFKKYGGTVDAILEGLDLRNLNAGCIDFDSETVRLNELQQLEIDKLCEHDTEIEAISTELSNLDIASRTIEIDLDCLTDEAAPCESGDNTYTLISILNTFVSAICTLRSQVDECCLGGGNHGTSGTTGSDGVQGTSGTSGGNGTSGESTTSGTSGTSGVEA